MDIQPYHFILLIAAASVSTAAVPPAQAAESSTEHAGLEAMRYSHHHHAFERPGMINMPHTTLGELKAELAISRYSGNKAIMRAAIEHYEHIGLTEHDPIRIQFGMHPLIAPSVKRGG